MFPFVSKLPPRDRHPLDLVARIGETADLTSVEAVSTVRRFVVDNPKVSCDGLNRVTRFSESEKLGMMRVSAGSAPQHGLCEEGFTPHRDKATRVKISRMQ
jgi:hypothetical protein